VLRLNPIALAALQHARESFLGTLAEREAGARHVITQGRSGRKDDMKTALELVRRVPVPLLARLVDDGVKIKIERDPAERVLREVATAIDATMGRGEVRWSEATVEFADAIIADQARIPPHFGGAAPAIFVEVMGRWVGRDPTLPNALPKLHAALMSMMDKEGAAEDARQHPERVKRVMAFLRLHVLSNPRISETAKSAIARRVQRESGPWDQIDMERHAKGVRESPGHFVVDTRWGAEPYPLEGAPDGALEKTRLVSFLDKFVRTNARISPKGKERLEKSAAIAYGPWRSDDFDRHLTGVFESRNRFVVQTKGGNVTVELG